MQTNYKVEAIMSENVIVIEPEVSVTVCAQKMNDKKIGSAIVSGTEGVVGILTEQDITRKIVAAIQNPNDLQVEDIMSAPLISIEPDKDVYDAMVVMGKHNIRHLPVIRGDVVVGIVSLLDIIKIEPALLELEEFKESMAE